MTSGTSTRAQYDKKSENKCYCIHSTSQLTINSNHPTAQQSVILHDAPSTLPTSLISTLVSSDKVGSVFITDVTSGTGNPYGAFASFFSSFVSTVASDS